MSLKFALLGLIALEPRSGYDIKRIVDSSIHFIWNVTGPQIYTTLRSLREQGLISTKHVPQSGKPDKQVHTITKSGRAQLERLANQRIRASVTRDEILLRIFFGNFADASVVLQELKEYLERIRVEREFMESTKARVLAHPGTRHEARRFQILSLRLKVAQWRSMERELQKFLKESYRVAPVAPRLASRHAAARSKGLKKGVDARLSRGTRKHKIGRKARP